MRLSSIKFSLVALCFALPSIALAAPDASSFKRVKKTRNVTIAGCAVDGVDGEVKLKATIASRKVSVSLPNTYKRAPLNVGLKGNRFAACGVSDADPTKTVLFLKKKKRGAATEHALALTQFEEGSTDNLGRSCQTVRSWPGAFIYKTVGSHHFTDIRRNTIGLILKVGASVPRVQCVDIIAKNGEKVGDFGFYASGAGWHSRYYGGVGCGDAINGSKLAQRARSAAGSETIYARFGSTCYGPITASRCVGSKAC